jgi:hypothetical protein
MATLIQSKQIQGVVTASVIEGDFVTQGSITGSSISASQVLGVKYDDIEGTPNFIGGTGITITEVGDTITITNTGGGGGVSGSSELISSVAQLNAYTASTDIRLDGLSSQTGSYLTSLPTNLVSGSDQLTSSYDQRYALSGSVGGDSTDISSLNNYTSSTDSRLDTIETFTSSIEGRITTLENQTDNTGSDNQTLTIVGDQLTIVGGNTITIPTGSGGISTDISSLNSFTASYFTDSSSFDSRITTEKDRVDDILSGANADYDTFKEIVDLINSVDTTNDQAFASFYTASNDKFESLETFTESIEGRIATLENQTDNTGSDSQTLSIVGDQLTIVGGNTITIPTGSELPSGLISGSSQITELGFTSESTDISSLNEFTQSYFTDSASFDTRIDNLVSSTVPQGTISGSDQLTSSYDLRYLLSGSDLSVPFNGNRDVTNQYLGVSGDNFGTTGSLKDFIEAVFFPNTLPTITYSNRDVDISGSVSGAVAIDVTLTDTENNGPFSFSINGGDSDLFDVIPQNADSSSWDIIIATSSLDIGTYEITGSATDNTNEPTILSTTFTVTPVNNFGEVYVYTNDRGAGFLTPSNYTSVMGGTTVATNGDTPPEFISFDTGSILDKIGQSLGDSTIDVSAGGNTFTLTRRVLSSGSNLSQVLENASVFNGDGEVQEQLLVMFASGSDMGGIPTSIAQSFGGSTTGEYVLNVNDAGTFATTISDAQINSITLDTPHLGFSEWFIIGRTGSNTASSYEIRLTPSSGSAPTS